MEMLVLDWGRIHSSVLELSRRIEESGFRPDSIVGVARGGWVVARLLSDLLGVDELLSIRVSFYRGVNQREAKPRIESPIAGEVKGKRILVADDVADTGESLLLVVDHLSSMGASAIRVATLHVKPWSKIKPDYFVESTASWILYPWEYRETISNLLKEWGKDGIDPAKARERLVSAGIPLEIIEKFSPSILKEIR
ncbi:MAG: phosphoribosyltransferase [Candidatus Methanosuratincola petrocarbonis]